MRTGRRCGNGQTCADFKQTLGEDVKDVRVSERLTDSAVCLVAADGDMDLHLERMLRQQGHMNVPSATRILELNPSHPLIKKLTGLVDQPADGEILDETARLLLAGEEKESEREPRTA